MDSSPRTSRFFLWNWAPLALVSLRLLGAPASAQNDTPTPPPAQPTQDNVLEAVPAKPDTAAPSQPAPGAQTGVQPGVQPGSPGANPANPANPAESAPAKEPILAEAPVQTGAESAPAANPSGKISFSSCTVEGSQVAITFDDGPHATHTPRLLDILKQKGVRATFFVVGQNAQEYPEILKRIAAEGHELANHSFTHPVLASLSEGGLREQLEKTHQAVHKATGINMKLMRPPYGALSEPQRRWVHAHFGYRVILWDVDPLDWKVRDAAKVENAIVSKAHSGSIILAHDIHKTTVDAVPAILDELLRKGLRFVTVSELLALDKPAAAKPAAAPSRADAGTSPTKTETKTKAEKSSLAAISSVFRGSPKSSPASSKTASPEKSEKKTAEKPEKAADKPTAKSGDKNTQTASGHTAAQGGKKFSQLSEEEVKKKWLESLKR